MLDMVKESVSDLSRASGLKILLIQDVGITNPNDGVKELSKFIKNEGAKNVKTIINNNIPIK